MASYVYVTQQKKRYADYTVDAVFDCICQRLGIKKLWPWSPKTSMASSIPQAEQASAHGSIGINSFPTFSKTFHAANGTINQATTALHSVSLTSIPASTTQTGTQSLQTHQTQSALYHGLTPPPSTSTPPNSSQSLSASQHSNGTSARSSQQSALTQAGPASPAPNYRPEPILEQEMPSVGYAPDSGSGSVAKSSEDRFLSSNRSDPLPNSSPTYERQDPSYYAPLNARAAASMPANPTTPVSSNHHLASLQATPTISEEEAINNLKEEYFRPASDEEIDAACKDLRKAPFNVDRSRIFVFNHIKSSDRYAKICERFSQKTNEQWTSAYPLFFTKSIPTFLQNILEPSHDVTLREENRVFINNPALIAASTRYVLICDAVRQFVNFEANPNLTINFAGVVLPLFLVERKQ